MAIVEEGAGGGVRGGGGGKRGEDGREGFDCCCLGFGGGCV